MPILEAAAADSADPAKLSLTQTVYRNGKKVTDYQRETAISMNAPDKYTYYDGGVFTFRGNSFRQNAASGTVEVEDDKLSIEWKYQMGASARRLWHLVRHRLDGSAGHHQVGAGSPREPNEPV